MIEHGFLNLVWLAVLVAGLAAAFRSNARRAARDGARRDAERRAVRAPLPVGRRPVAAAAKPPVQIGRPRTAALQQAESATAFPEVDLSLPDAGGLLRTAGTRPVRARRGAAAIGSRRWAADAIVGAEVLGPPLALRSGATFGAPRAF
jgi:hypothetical protein